MFYIFVKNIIKNNNYEDYKIKDVKDWGDPEGFQMFIAKI